MLVLFHPAPPAAARRQARTVPAPSPQAVALLAFIVAAPILPIGRQWAWAQDLAPLADGPHPSPVDQAPSLEADRGQPPPAAPAQALAPDQAASLDITVRSEAERLAESADAVHVVDTRQAKQETADLGEVLARTQGVNVRRDGGLGSAGRLSLNGLAGEQIRFFFDGVPLDLAGYPFGIGNLPVNLIDRVEIYRGVVPLRLGADALGGAVNVVSDDSFRTRAGVSYQTGSFGTHRVTLDAGHRHRPTGLVVAGNAFLDRSRNDYPVDVRIPDERGRLEPTTVRRFHDGYRAVGATLDLGLVGRPWTRRLSVKGFAASYDKELQHNLIMTVPYGEAEHGESVFGATGRYDVDLPRAFGLELVATASRRTSHFSDASTGIYTWRGERLGERTVGGEILAYPSDQVVWQDAAFGRALLTFRPHQAHTLRLGSSPTITSRTGDERLQVDPSTRDPLTARRDLFTVVSGLEYEASALSDRLSNIAFVKTYFYRADTEEQTFGVGPFTSARRQTLSVGAGNGLRFRFFPWLMAKASYEYATRLPSPQEVFGDGALVRANLGLEPEQSHNANLGPRIDLEDARFGRLVVDANAFLRQSSQLIVLLALDRTASYENVYGARSLGVETGAAWHAPRRFAAIEGTFTWQDLRNASARGSFGTFDGDRIPNRPHLFGSWGARLRLAGLTGAANVIEPYYAGRYVHAFYRSWESLGLREFKQVVDRQLTHNAGVTWTLDRDFGEMALTFEVDNLTNAKVFDNFGVQRPGRAFYVKLTGEAR